MRLANENSKLAIEKQGQVVQCLADLSTILSAGMHRRSTTHRHFVPDDSPPDFKTNSMVGALDKQNAFGNA